MNSTDNTFFTISFDFIALDQKIPYDLYVNSSSNEKKKKFVRIFPVNDLINAEELKEFKKKYHQLYVHESQRAKYLKSLVDCLGPTTVQKTEVIKESAIYYLDKLFDKNKDFNTEILSETLQGCKQTIESMVDIIKDYDILKIQNLIGSLSFHDFYTYDHSINVSMYCIALYTAYRPNAPKEEIVLAGLGGLLHDIGKIKIPTEIINNPQKLSPAELEIIKKHPDYGFQLLKENACHCQGVDFLTIQRIVHEHHENFNGTGYPKKLDSYNIHLLARLTSIADFFDAITTKRAYHEVLNVEDAIAVMSKASGRKLDPDLFGVFTTSMRQLAFSGMITRELPDDFDPCRPQNVLPFLASKNKYKVEGFGKKEEPHPLSTIKKRIKVM